MWLAPGPEQAVNGSESKRHLKVEPDSVDENVKVGVRSVLESGGPPVIVVCGGIESLTQVRAAEQVEMLPAASRVEARKIVVELSATETPRPGEANWVAVPEATGAPVQVAVL